MSTSVKTLLPIKENLEQVIIKENIRPEHTIRNGRFPWIIKICFNWKKKINYIQKTWVKKIQTFLIPCKKNKTSKNKHFKYDKKDLGNIKPTKDYACQDYICLIFILSNYWQETKEEKTYLKSLSQVSLSDVTYKRFYRNLISHPQKWNQDKTKELCKCLCYQPCSAGKELVFVKDEDSEHQVAGTFILIAMEILKLPLYCFDDRTQADSKKQKRTTWKSLLAL